MKKRIILLAICFLSLSVFSQEEENVTNKNEFGVHLGSTTGIGLSYRHWFNNSGFQLTALPILTDEYDFVSAGLTFLHSFKNSKYFRFYGYIGNHVMYNTDIANDFQYNIGIGPGFAFGKSVRFNLMVGYGLYDVTDRLNTYPSGEIGLYYCF